MACSDFISAPTLKATVGTDFASLTVTGSVSF
jgi:hypothetical protein